MDLISVLIFLVILVGIAWLAHWLITKFLPQPAQMIALAIVGILLLVVLLSRFLPNSLGIKVW